MSSRLTKYAKLGLNHHQLFRRALHHPEYHYETLKKVIELDYIEVLDIFLPYGKYRKPSAEIVRASGKTVIYNTPSLPVTHLAPCSLNPTAREQMLILMKDQIDAAYLAGADYFLLVSGPDPGIELRREAYQVFYVFLTEVCEYLQSKGNMGLLIEHFDRDIAVKFLCGPSRELVELIRRLNEAGYNAGIELDFAHVPAIGETFEEAVKICFPFLKHVHLGNCIIDDPEHPAFGDQHPPLGCPGSRIGVNETAEILSQLLKCGYLNKENRGMLSLEVRPPRGVDKIEFFETNMEMVRRAWRKVQFKDHKTNLKDLQVSCQSI